MIARTPPLVRSAPVLLSLLIGGGCGGTPSAAGSAPAAAQPTAAAATPAPSAAPATLTEGVYTVTQSEAGKRVWGEICSECHSTSEMRGTDFMFEWEGSSVGRLYRVLTTTMPDDDPGSLADDQYLAVIAYILQLNEFPPGNHPLTADPERLDGLRIQR